MYCTCADTCPPSYYWQLRLLIFRSSKIPTAKEMKLIRSLICQKSKRRVEMTAITSTKCPMERNWQWMTPNRAPGWFNKQLAIAYSIVSTYRAVMSGSWHAPGGDSIEVSTYWSTLSTWAIISSIANLDIAARLKASTAASPTKNTLKKTWQLLGWVAGRGGSSDGETLNYTSRFGQNCTGDPARIPYPPSRQSSVLSCQA